MKPMSEVCTKFEWDRGPHFLWPGREVHPPFDEYFPPLTPARGQGLTSPAQPSPAQPSPAQPGRGCGHEISSFPVPSLPFPPTSTSTSTSILHPATTRDDEMASMRQLLGPHQLSIGQLRCQHINIMQNRFLSPLFQSGLLSKYIRWLR